MALPLNPVHLERWIEENQELFEPPVSNQVVFADSDFIFMVVRGPNARNDFHIDPGDEIFYQLEGTIQVDIRRPLPDGADGPVESHLVAPGELFLVPADVPHSPLRPADTWGVVVERQRRDGELDRIRWYCDCCDEVLYERQFALADIVTELKAILDEFNASEALRTCRCGCVKAVAEPFMLREDPNEGGP
ncbi:MAG: 3-hydroxyanthranilate 3,4-dioxygenase [Acidimicrobiales bacterium]|nr:3-hydroxyanthranilate 3,4-dioxygenase [Acidimicrobiales bacterium]